MFKSPKLPASVIMPEVSNLLSAKTYTYYGKDSY